MRVVQQARAVVARALARLHPASRAPASTVTPTLTSPHCQTMTLVPFAAGAVDSAAPVTRQTDLPTRYRYHRRRAGLASSKCLGAPGRPVLLLDTGTSVMAALLPPSPPPPSPQQQQRPAHTAALPPGQCSGCVECVEGALGLCLGRTGQE